MGNDQSSPSATEEQHQAAAAVSAVTAAAKHASKVDGGRGRESALTTKEVESANETPSKSMNLGEEAVLVEEPVLVESEDDFSSDEEEESVGDESDEDEEEEDEEYDEFLLERLRILADAASLKNVATHFLHPEEPVSASPECFGRNYFDRPSAPEQLERDEAEEIAQSIADAEALKKSAVQYVHPEVGVVTEDSTATARCFFDRPSAPEVLDQEEAEEIAQSLSDAAQLRKLAADYSHPEAPVATSDPVATARCYFSRPSAEPYEEEEVDADRDDVLEDMAQLKRAAYDYLHPEARVQTTDATLFGRNYFNRVSAPETEDEEIDAERDEVLEDVAELRKLASDHMHPEKPVDVDPAAFARNYCNRASAPDQEDLQESEERAAALADARALKKLAVDYAHPEVGVETSDPAAFGRNYFARPSAEPFEEEEVDADCDDILADAANLKKLAKDYAHPEAPVVTSPEVFGRNYFNYFNRASAPETEEEEIDAERDDVLEDVLALKKLASDFAHPEKPVQVDPAAFGRNYFDRASAPSQEDKEEAEERAAALADAQALKKLAADYAHPEVGVETTDATALGRNYFSRPSAEPYEEEEVDADRDDVLEDVAALRKLARDYSHPEAPVTASPECFGRNYFDRASAPREEDLEEAEERAAALADASALKKLAKDYAHPEVGVKTTDPAAFGRNYFSRPSAGEYEEEDVDAERDDVLEDALALKKLAADHAHPEKPVVASPEVFGRNYFKRASAPSEEDMEEAEERAAMLADCAGLKKLAVDFAHPEVGVTTSDAAAFGRNYFTRPSAEPFEEEDVDADRDDVLEDVLALKKLASDYAHPEAPVVASPEVFGRSYFDRASAPSEENREEAEERAAALADAAGLKKLAVDYAHPEVGVETTNATAFGRNYFSRPSAEPYEEEEVDADRDDVLEDMAALKKLASDYAHPEAPVVSSPEVFARNYFNRASAPATEEEDIDAERDEVLEDVLALKTLASDFAHPENPVNVDPAAFGRNYFGRASAPQLEDGTDAEERDAVLAEISQLKKLATDYAHPEVGVTSSDPECFARNYFSRPSAPQQEDPEAAYALADAAALKKLAMDYAHPEAPASTTDPAATARCYYSRYSSPTHNDSLISAKRTDKAAAPQASAPLGGEFEHVEGRQETAKPKASKAAGGEGEGDIPRTSSSHMLFGMAKAS